MPSALTVASLARMIDDTLLRPDATENDMARHCRDASQRGVATVAVNPAWVSFCASQLRGSKVGVCAAVSLPLGQSTTTTKVYEARFVSP
jgi:deoxyribose-phosphate aldolase